MRNLILKIQEFITDEEIKEGKLLKYLNLSDPTLLYVWKRGESIPCISNYIKLAEYFNISLDYLFDRTENQNKIYKYNVEKFYINLRKIMIRENKTRYKMIYKDLICASSNFVKWKNGSIPTPETLIKLADYLSVSVDELLSVE